MFVSKISSTHFGGYQHSVNKTGEHVYTFSYPHDNEQDVRVEFYRPFAKDGDSPVKVINLKDNNIINFDEIQEFDGVDVIPYRVILDGKPVADSGFYTADRSSGNGFNLVNRKVTTPMVQGQGILTMPDTHRPGAYYEDFESPYTGKVRYSIQKQRESENTIRSFSNMGGGGLAGIEYDIELLHKAGVKKVFMTPVWGYDDKSGHHYWNKNDMQIPESVGSVENYETMVRKLYQNGMQYVDDFAVTSYGIEGLPVQYTLRWANQNPQTYYWFRMNGLQNGPLTLGIVPKNRQENLRYRIINPNVIYNSEKGRIERNPEYNPRKETYFQIYDVSQVTKEQLNDKNKLIKEYKNTYSENKLAINNSEDTLIPYAFEVRPNEYQNRLEEFVRMKKKADEPINFDSPEAAMFIGQFTNFKIGTDAEGAVFWDANKDILKRNYYISGYDEKLIKAMPNQSQREYMRNMLYRANCEVQDIAIQAGVYRTQLVKDVQTLYTAQTLKNASSKEQIDKLIGIKLPKEARLDDETISNIIEGWYNLEPKGVLSSDEVTVRALMKLPLDTLEFGDNTVGVLMASFFTNRAYNNDTIGLSRYDYYRKNIGVDSPYDKIYYKVDDLYETKLKNFAHEVMKQADKTSPERLLDKNGNYTEYGEYVVDLLGKDIAKYAFLKAVAGEKLQAKIMPDDVHKGKITYNYSKLREDTTLKSLGINCSSPEEEAKALYRVISDGLSDLNKKDVDFVAKSVSKQIEGTTVNGFRLAEAMVGKAGLGLDFRLDAAKDITDMDAVRNGDMSFDEAWDQVIDFWKKYVREIKKVNPNAYIVAEITDVEKLLRNIYGENTNVYDADLSKAGGKYKNVPDALRAFFQETGITSEAGYSYTFTDVLRLFSADGENGDINKNGISSLEGRMQALINSNNLDYIQNLWTFADNHDKPSMLHVMALDMEVFHTKDLNPYFRDTKENFDNEYYEKRRRNARIAIMQELTNSDKFEDLPLEAMMNIDNIEYFKTANTRSAAMSMLMRSAINDTIPDSFEGKTALKQALVDLTNGNYLSDRNNINIKTINIPSLQTLEGALEEIFSKTNLNLKDAQKKAIIERAKQREMIEKYAVRGDFDWYSGKHWTAVELQNRAKSVLNNEEFDFMQYSPYVVSVAALLLDSYKEVTGVKDTTDFTNGTRDFVHKYNRNVVNNSSSKLPYTEDSSIVRTQKSYAARDFENVIEMIIQQAEYKSGKKFTKSERDYIMRELFVSATEPAVEKALMYSAYLSALPGNPSLYYRDILGGLGYDEKAKNIFLQSRNTVKYSQIEENGPLKEYRTKIFNSFQEVMRIRNTEGLGAINGGTPYMLKTNNPDTLAMLYKKGEDTAITIINTNGIDPHNRVEYGKKDNGKKNYVPVQGQVELDDIIIPASMGLAVGTIFISTIGGEKIEYVVNKAKDGTYRLVRKDGKKIVLNEKTAKWGAMFLKIFKKKPPFRGRNINQQYNIVLNSYQSINNNEKNKRGFIVSV